MSAALNAKVLWSEHSFIAFDETPIFYRLLKPSDVPKAIVIILHGMGEHGGRYVPFAEYLAGLGFQSYVPDLRGFGRGGGRRACVKQFSDFQNDLHALHSWVARTHREIPVFVLGHSFGGLVASSTLSAYKDPKASGLVLTSPIFGIGIPVPRWRHWLGLVAAYLFPNYAQPNRVNPRVLTHDEEILRVYGDDPLIFHRISARLYRELCRAMNDKNRIAQNLKIPTLVLQAGCDFIVSKEETLKFYDKLTAPDKELEVYQDYYHEILNEVHRDVVYSRIGLWISKHLAL